MIGSASRSRWIRRGFLFGSAIAFISVAILAHEVLLPFVLALLVAYVLWPLVFWVQTKTGMKRALAILLVYVFVLGTLGSFLRLVVPRVAQEVGSLRRELPELGVRVQEEWTKARAALRDSGIAQPNTAKDDPKEQAAIIAKPRADGTFAIDVGQGFVITPTRNGAYAVEPIREARDEHFDFNRILAETIGKSFAYAERNALELAKIGRDIIAGVSRVVFVFGITLMLAAYIMLTRERIFGFFSSLVRPSARHHFDLLLERIDLGLSGVVRGQLIICLLNGALSAIGFAIVGLKYWPVLALVCAVMSLIPIFGSIASAVPAVALALTQGLPTAAFVLLWIVGIHQIEANLLNPKIMGDSAKIHPVLVVFALLVGEHFFHTIGALLAVPVMSIAQSVFLHFRAVVEQDDPDFVGEAPPIEAPESLAPPAQK